MKKDLLKEKYMNGSINVNIKPGPLEFLSIKERKEDIEQLYNVLSENYPYFSLKKKKFNYDWLAHKEDFIKWGEECTTNEEFYLVIKKIVMLLQNNHTQLLNPSYRAYLGEVYEGNDSWSKVLNHKGVIRKYEGWAEMSLPNPYVLPGEFKYIEGKYIYCSEALSEEEKIEALPEGVILEKISGRPIDNYIASLIDDKYIHYDYKRDKPIIEVLRIFTDKKKTLTLGFRDEDGERFSRKIISHKYYPNFHGNNMNNKEESNIKIDILKEGSTAYIKINSFASRHVQPDNKVLENSFIKFKDYSNLIIDVRGNGGGNEEYYMENILPYIMNEKKTAYFYLIFRHGSYVKSFLKDRGLNYNLKDKSIKITEELPQSLNLHEEYRKNFGFFIPNSRTINSSKYTGFKGEIYILTDHHTYSAAETFAAFAKATNIATIVGTTTGGDGVNIDPCVLALKNSGLVVRFAMSMGINGDGTINEETHTSPHIYVEQGLKDFMSSKDSVLEFIKTI